MNGVSREEITNLIHLARLEWKNEHAIEGCEPIRSLQRYIEGDLKSDIHNFKTANTASLEISRRVELLDNPISGRVTKIEGEWGNVKKWMISFAITLITFLGGFFWTQNVSLKKTDAKLDLTCQYQLAQTLFVKYSVTGDKEAKLEAEQILKTLGAK